MCSFGKAAPLHIKCPLGNHNYKTYKTAREWVATAFVDIWWENTVDNWATVL